MRRAMLSLAVCLSFACGDEGDGRDLAWGPPGGDGAGKQDSSADDPESDGAHGGSGSGGVDDPTCPRGTSGCPCAPDGGCKLGLMCVAGSCETCVDCVICGDDDCDATESCEICPHDCGECEGGIDPTGAPDACEGQADGPYCGEVLAGDPDVLYVCAAGRIAKEESCALGCASCGDRSTCVLDAQASGDACLPPPSCSGASPCPSDYQECDAGSCQWCSTGSTDCDGATGCECQGYCSAVTPGICCDGACSEDCPC